MTSHVTDNIPSSPDDRAQLKQMLVEMTNAMLRADSEKEYIKEAAASAQEKFGIKKKTLMKLARTMYKQNYADLQAENEHFELLYETLVEGKKV